MTTPEEMRLREMRRNGLVPKTAESPGERETVTDEIRHTAPKKTDDVRPRVTPRPRLNVWSSMAAR